MSKKKDSWNPVDNDWLIPEVKPEGCDPWIGGYRYGSM